MKRLEGKTKDLVQQGLDKMAKRHIFIGMKTKKGGVSMLHWDIKQTAENIREQISQFSLVYDDTDLLSIQLISFYEMLNKVDELDGLFEDMQNGDRASYVVLKNLVNNLLFAVYDYFEIYANYVKVNADKYKRIKETFYTPELYEQVQSLYVMLRSFKKELDNMSERYSKDLTKWQKGIYL